MATSFEWACKRTDVLARSLGLPWGTSLAFRQEDSTLVAECRHVRVAEVVHVDIDFKLSPLRGEGHPYDSKHAGQAWSGSLFASRVKAVAQLDRN